MKSLHYATLMINMHHNQLFKTMRLHNLFILHVKTAWPSV